jgi:hypothetical protein
MSEYTSYTVRRAGNRNLSFDGLLLAHVQNDGIDRVNGHEIDIRIFRTKSGRLVGSIEDFSCYGRNNQSRALVTTDEVELGAFIGYDELGRRAIDEGVILDDEEID